MTIDHNYYTLWYDYSLASHTPLTLFGVKGCGLHDCHYQDFNLHVANLELPNSYCSKHLFICTQQTPSESVGSGSIHRVLARVSSSGGKLPPQNTQLPPQKEREKEEKREGERERGGEGRGACIFLRCSASDQYSPLLHDSII